MDVCGEVLEARPGIEPGCADLQSATSPLRHRAGDGAQLLRFSANVNPKFVQARLHLRLTSPCKFRPNRKIPEIRLGGIDKCGYKRSNNIHTVLPK